MIVGEGEGDGRIVANIEKRLHLGGRGEKKRKNI